MTIIWCMVPEIWSLTEFFVILSHFLPFYSTTTQKIKIKKKKKDKNSWRYHHFTKMYQKSSSYATLFLRYGTWWINCYFSFEATFCPSTPPPPHPPPPAAYKIKMLEDIISLHKCTKIMIICCTVPEIWQVTNVIIFYFGLLFVLLPPPNSRKNQNLWKMKKLPGNITILQMCIKNYNQMITNLFGSCQPPTPVLKTNNHWYLKGGQAQFCLCCTYSPNVNQLWKPWSGDNTLKVTYRSM